MYKYCILTTEPDSCFTVLQITEPKQLSKVLRFFDVFPNEILHFPASSWTLLDSGCQRRERWTGFCLQSFRPGRFNSMLSVL